MNRETELQKVARRYRRQGYEVSVHPRGGDLPSFLGDVEPDMIARNSRECVVVEVKARPELSANHQLTDLAAVVNAQPGWRLDLVVTSPREWPDAVADDSTEPSVPEIRSLIRTAGKLVTGGYTGAASLIAWSAVEAAMRALSRRLSISLDNKYPDYIAKTLYAEGILSHAEYQQLRGAMAIRNAIAHGLKSSELKPQVPEFLTDLAGRLLDYEPSAASN